MGREHVERLHEAIVYVVKTACEARADAALYPANWMFHSRSVGGGEYGAVQDDRLGLRVFSWGFPGAAPCGVPLILSIASRKGSWPARDSARTLPFSFQCAGPVARESWPAAPPNQPRWTNGKPGTIQGKKTAILTVGGRTSAYVPELQKMVKGGGFAAADGEGKGGGGGRKAGSAKAASAKAGRAKAGAAKKPKAAAAKQAASDEESSGSDGAPTSSEGAASSGSDSQGRADEAPPVPKAARSRAGRGKTAAGAAADGANGAAAKPAGAANADAKVRVGPRNRSGAVRGRNLATA
jgi:hypothetical protein